MYLHTYMRPRTKTGNMLIGLLAFVAALIAVAAVYLWNETPISKNKAGSFRVGALAPYMPGDTLHHPYGIVPPSRFYIYVWQNGFRSAQCVYDECGKGGAVVAALRGWLWGTGFEREWFQFSDAVSSVVLVADQRSHIVGIYPNATMFDVERILKKHPDLADLGRLEGVEQLGLISVGKPLPFTPDHIFADIEQSSPVPRFYVYIVHETIHDTRYCPYYECGAYIDWIYHAGGAFNAIDHNDPEIITQLGLSPQQVARGEVTLVVIADANGTILSIHPNKDMRDIPYILMQHPDLADLSALFPK